MSTATKLLTAEEYARLPETDVPTELVRGEVVEMTSPGAKHGFVCLRVGRLLGNFAEDRHLGWVFSNDTGIVTERDPDTVRGGDLWFVGFNTLPADAELPEGYLDLVPDLVVEVLSPSSRPGQTQIKVGEYLNLGVPVVCVLDPFRETADLYCRDGSHQVLGQDEELEFPEQLPGFKVRVCDFFHPPSQGRK